MFEINFACRVKKLKRSEIAIYSVFIVQINSNREHRKIEKAFSKVKELSRLRLNSSRMCIRAILRFTVSILINEIRHALFLMRL